MARTPEQIFRHHAEALLAGDMDEFMSDYGDDSVLITAGGAVRGNGQIRDAFRGVLNMLTSPSWDLHTRMEGVDTFVFSDDGIRAHTVHFVAEPVAS